MIYSIFTLLIQYFLKKGGRTKSIKFLRNLFNQLKIKTQKPASFIIEKALYILILPISKEYEILSGVLQIKLKSINVIKALKKAIIFLCKFCFIISKINFKKTLVNEIINITNYSGPVYLKKQTLLKELLSNNIMLNI